MSLAAPIYRAPPTTSNDSTMPEGLADALRLCSSCKKFKIPVALKYKTCSECRERTRRLQRARQDRKVLEALNKERRRDASKMKLARFYQTCINNSMKGICTEYQTSSELLKTLKDLSISTSLPTGQFLQFYGSYTIVTVPDVNNLQRVWLLANELRAKPWLSFRFEPPLSLVGDASHQTLSFACSCSGVSTTPALASTVPHSNSENISTNGSFITPGICRGVIILKAIVDNTHPLGIPGQLIVVHVEHPLTQHTPMTTFK